MRARVLMLILSALLIAAAPAAVLATSMVPVSLADLAARSEKVFAGRVIAAEVVETADGWGEYVAMEVTDDLLGNAPRGETVSWVQARLSETTRFPGMPRFSPGEEWVVFLAGRGRGTSFQAPYGLGQGAFHLHRDAASGRSIAHNEFGNGNLATNLEVETLAARIVDRDPALATKSATERTAAVAATEMRLATLGSGADPAFLRQAVQAVRSFPDPAAALTKAPARPPAGS